MSEPVIRLSEVHKAYGRGAARTNVLRGVSMEVARGEFLALVGASGSGKSTLLNIVGGLDRADRGEVEVLGQKFGRTRERDVARLRNTEIGFVFQAFHLLDHLDCLANVTLPSAFASGADDREAGRAALERVGLAGFEKRRPGELSGGQKQRVAIARAVFRKPSLLLCDEPTGNLDSDTGRQVIDLFKSIHADGTTLIIVTHEERISTVAERVIRIRDGAIAGEQNSDAEPHEVDGAQAGAG